MKLSWNKLLRWLPMLLICMAACAVVASAQGPEKRESPFEEIKVEDGDSSAMLSWKIKREFEGRIKDVSISILKDGREVMPTVPLFKHLADVKKDSYTVEGLTNGWQHVFEITVRGRDEEIWKTRVNSYPGTSGLGSPSVPGYFYSVPADGKATLFWERGLERDLKEYEVFRKGPGEDDFSLIGKSPKKVEIKDRDNKRSSMFVIPGVFEDRGVENGKEYLYRIRAVDIDGNAGKFTEAAHAAPEALKRPSGNEVVLIVNSNEGDSNANGMNDSVEVALHYAEQRGVPLSQIFKVDVNKDPYRFDYDRDLKEPLRKHMLKGGLAGKIRYLVPCYGIPIRARDRALDSMLSDLFDRFTWGMPTGTPNPFFQSGSRFDGSMGIYLVTRLDGPDVEAAKSLSDKAIYAEKNSVSASGGKAFFGNHGRKDSIGFKAIEDVAGIAKAKGIDTDYREGTFGEEELGGDAYWYFAWYHHYKDPIKGEWPEGAVGAHLISYSFSTIRETRPDRLKSWVQGLLEKGITATFGSVVEPYVHRFTRPDIFFRAFWSGEYNFAESFYMATPTVQWAMSAVGDPLYRLEKGR